MTTDLCHNGVPEMGDDSNGEMTPAILESEGTKGLEHAAALADRNKASSSVCLLVAFVSIPQSIPSREPLQQNHLCHVGRWKGTTGASALSVQYGPFHFTS